MKTRGLFITLMLLANWAHAAPDIEGRWLSDKAASKTYNRQHAVLSQAQIDYISQMLGNMSVVFEDGIARLRMPAVRIEKDGIVTEYEGFQKQGRYVIIGEDEGSIAPMLHGAGGRATLMVYHFVSEDRMWV
jgi:hypothetical protein